MAAPSGSCSGSATLDKLSVLYSIGLISHIRAYHPLLHQQFLASKVGQIKKVKYKKLFEEKGEILNLATEHTVVSGSE